LCYYSVRHQVRDQELSDADHDFNKERLDIELALYEHWLMEDHIRKRLFVERKVSAYSWPDDRLTYLRTGTMAEIYDCKIEKTFYSQRSRPTFLRWDPRNNHEVPDLMKH